MFSSTSSPGGGLPCPRIVAATLWMYSAIALMSSSASGSAGIGGMPGVLTAVLDDRHDQLAVLIVEHHLRAQQVGPADVAAAKVAAMARAAVDLVQGLAAGDRLLIGQRALLRGERGPSATSPLAGAWPRPAG